MAGRGKRLRPHTLTVPKPLVKLAGKPIVQHLIEDIAEVLHEPITKVVFVTGHFGKEAEEHLIGVAQSLGAVGEIVYQEEALGTAHAIWCAREYLRGKTIVAFADTLFKADFQLDTRADGVLWVKQIEDPSSFGVVKLNEKGQIVDFVEKPKSFISDLAMIGIYYFKKGEELKEEIAYLIENEVVKGGEYQLPDALKRLTEKGTRFVPGKVDEWMDCGNAKVTIETSNRVLSLKYAQVDIPGDARIIDSLIIEPVYIGPGAVIRNSVVGPHASIGAGTQIESSVIRESLVQENSVLKNLNLSSSMIGSFTRIEKQAQNLSVGDYNVIE
jgi:glucose-1-phosphate thymidylyltransferase